MQDTSVSKENVYGLGDWGLIPDRAKVNIFAALFKSALGSIEDPVE